MAAAAGELLAAIRDLLVEQGLETAAKALAAAYPSMPSAAQAQQSPEAARKLSLLVGAMNSGNEDAFFTEWNSAFGAGAASDPRFTKLEFYIRIYFAVFPALYPSSGADPAVAMAAFREYIETRGAGLAQTTEFLPYYAMPFVVDLRAHPTFRVLFATDWVANLHAQLGDLVSAADASSGSPAAAALWAAWADRGSGGGQAINALQAKLAGLENTHDNLIAQHQALQKNYHTLLGTASELVEALESSIKGDSVAPDYLMSIVLKLNDFSSVTQSQMMSRVRRERSSSTDGAGPAASAPQAVPTPTVTVAPPPSTAVPRVPTGEPRVGGVKNIVPPAAAALTQSLAVSMENAPLPQLDDGKIRKHLSTLTDLNAALLLQALRWRITRSKPGVQRKGVLDDFAICDYLGVSQQKPNSGPLYQLIRSSSIEVREYATRLLNCLASISKGREYLLRREVILALVEQMIAEDGDTMVRQNILGTLQKLSLRRSAQTFMIEQGTISWLHETLVHRVELCEYSEEYAVALLMNLCLRSAGRRYCESTCPALMELLRDMLTHDNDQVRTYIHGALFTLLGSRPLRERAAEQQFEQALRARIETSGEEMATQLHYILEQLLSSEYEAEAADSDDEDEDDDLEDDSEDLTECDASEGETLRVPTGTLVGEQLLCSQYLRHRKDRSAGGRGLKSQAAEPSHPLARASPMLLRPVTPVIRAGSRNSLRSRAGTSESRPTSSARPASSRPTSSRAAVSANGSRTVMQASSMAQPKEPLNPPPPSQKVLAAASEKMGESADVVGEYNNIFATRPKVPRTPTGHR